MSQTETETASQTISGETMSRLRKAAQASVEQRHRTGHQDGWAWADEAGEPDSFEAFVEFKTDHGSDWDDSYLGQFSLADVDPESSPDYWADWVNEHNYSKPGYLRGFVEGVFDFWEQVQKQL